MEWCLASGTSMLHVHLGDQTWWMEHMWASSYSPSTFGAKWIQTYVTRSVIICEMLWHWPQELTINLILMVGLLGVVLLIQTCFLDPIYVRVAIKTPWVLIKKEKIHL